MRRMILWCCVFANLDVGGMMMRPPSPPSLPVRCRTDKVFVENIPFSMTDVELRENLCSVLYSAFDNDVIIGRVNMSCTNEEKYRCAHVALEHAVDIPIESIIRSLENKRHDIGKLNLSFWVCDQPARPEPDVRKNKSERGKKKKRLMEDEEPPRRQPGRRERTDPFPKEKWWL